MTFMFCTQKSAVFVILLMFFLQIQDVEPFEGSLKASATVVFTTELRFIPLCTVPSTVAFIIIPNKAGCTSFGLFCISLHNPSYKEPAPQITKTNATLDFWSATIIRQLQQQALKSHRKYAYSLAH